MTENTFNQPSKPHLLINHPVLPLVITLVILVIFDQTTWNRQFGLQFLLLTLLVLTGVLILSAVERKHIPWPTFLLLVPILFGAVMTIIHRAASVTFFNIILTLAGLVLLALTLLNGQWAVYRIREVLMGLLMLIQSMLADPIRVLIEKAKSKAHLPAQEKNAAWRKTRPYLRGVLIALPLLLVLGALLASADLIFRQSLGNLFNWIKVDNLFEFVFRTTYILIFTYFLAGAFIHALTRSAEKKALSPDKPVIMPFLGHVEAFIVLALVNLLFLGFIIIQLRYFFAGEANITIDGFTYAEYARRGFFELVAVALISLALYYTLSMITKRAQRTEKRIFSALGVLLMLQVGTMLVSAFQRLSLYEAAYGFTTLRTITHVFMIWLGILLAAVTLMEIFNQFKRLALVLLLVLFGFTLSLNLLNVDSFIARRNIEHAIAGNPLDANYLIRQVSDDGVPVLFAYSQAGDTPQDVKTALVAIQACRFAIRNTIDKHTVFWGSWHLATTRAEALFEQNRSTLEPFPFIIQSEAFTYEQDGQTFEDAYLYYYIEVNGEEVWCMAAD